MSVDASRPLAVFLVAGEESGDWLAAALMRALSAQLGSGVLYRGVGGGRMQAAGLSSLFPMSDLTAIGFAEVIGKLPLLIRRLRQTVEAIVASPPDVLILVDAPDFMHRVAHRVRKRLPNLAIIKYVAPTVWAWRPGRARAMRGDFDHVLALFPFEPEVMARLGGPPTTYVGHPLLSELPALRPGAADQRRRDSDPPLLLLLPGSRRRELARLGQNFGAAVGLLAARGHRFELVMPTPQRLESTAREMTRAWPIQPTIVTGEPAKQLAFRTARSALAASGTVTLELALAAVPFVAAYRVAAWEAWIGRIVLTTRSIVLANIVLGENIVPEFLQDDCTPGHLANALEPLLADGPARQAQMRGFATVDARMATGGVPAEQVAADVVLAVMAGKA